MPFFWDVESKKTSQMPLRPNGLRAECALINGINVSFPPQPRMRAIYEKVVKQLAAGFLERPFHSYGACARRWMNDKAAHPGILVRHPRWLMTAWKKAARKKRHQRRQKRRPVRS